MATNPTNTPHSNFLYKLTIETYISLILFWSLCIVVLMGFVSRYVFNSSLTWTEEVARYLLIVLVFVGSAVAIHKKAHIAIEFFYHQFNSTGRWITTIAIELILIAFMLFCAIYTYEVALSTKGQNMVSIEVSKSYIYWGVCIGFVLMVFRLCQRIYYSIISQREL